VQNVPPGQWIEGGHWNQNEWPGQHFPHKETLDSVAPHHPVALASNDGHLLWVNSLALRLANITRETPDPDTGAILRDGSGEPIGILQETATSLIFRVIPQPEPATSQELLAQSLTDLQRRGITSIHDIEDAQTLTLFSRLRAEHRLGVRVQMVLPRQLLPQVPAIRSSHHEDDFLYVGGIKIFADGTLGSQTAAMLESFTGNPGNFGILSLPEPEMKETVRRAAELDLNIAIHAIGDRAARVALNSIEYAQQSLQSSPTSAQQTAARKRLRYRVEHVQLIAPTDLERMQRLGVIASIQPFHAVADRDIAEQYWGKRARRAYAYRTMRDMGIPIALGSDSPVETYDPLRILFAATARRNPDVQRPPWLPDQALPISDALWAYTLGAAYAGGEEAHKGSLQAGKLGDAVVLRDDLLTTEQAHMTENSVQATIVGGEIVYGTL
jgi:predicted amidohydrolase YtcJ